MAAAWVGRARGKGNCNAKEWEKQGSKGPIVGLGFICDMRRSLYPCGGEGPRHCDHCSERHLSPRMRGFHDTFAKSHTAGRSSGMNGESGRGPGRAKWTYRVYDIRHR